MSETRNRYCPECKWEGETRLGDFRCPKCGAILRNEK